MRRALIRFRLSVSVSDLLSHPSVADGRCRPADVPLRFTGFWGLRKGRPYMCGVKIVRRFAVVINRRDVDNFGGCWVRCPEEERNVCATDKDVPFCPIILCRRSVCRLVDVSCTGKLDRHRGTQIKKKAAGATRECSVQCANGVDSLQYVAHAKRFKASWCGLKIVLHHVTGFFESLHEQGPWGHYRDFTLGERNTRPGKETP
ncbi:hypothetical protein ZHAS_00017440 [Anopheles sinensis]|uniref:Uncharacterized protein n=1 Tax=Anopheles sinensis TaxID=74873 RepID=A0A084WG99_ANOSI|nr:hypothetical protein ZHAS_00017440 [Anopheles sinensis]